MSNTDIRVVPGPANYYSHRGALARLDDFFTRSNSPGRYGSTVNAPWPGPVRSCRTVLTLPEQNGCSLKATVASTM